MEKAALLLNPSAGKGRSGKKRGEIEHCLQKHEIPYDLMVSQSEEHLRQLARQAAAEYRHIVGVGGDTTFKIIAGELLNDKGGGERQTVPTLGMIGTGSANDIVRSLGIQKIESLCRAIKEKNTRKMDVGILNSETEAKPLLFLGSLSIGLGTTVNRYIEAFCQRHPQLAKFDLFGQVLAGAMAVHRSFARGQVPRRATLKHDGTSTEIAFSLLTFLNIPFYANGLRLGPNTTPFDGLLEAVVIQTVSLPGTLTMAIAVGRGRHEKRQDCRIISAPGFRLIPDGKMDILADGDIVTEVGPFEVSLRPAALRVFSAL
jgi:diacylglycerol kinase (ATP)